MLNPLSLGGTYIVATSKTYIWVVYTLAFTSHTTTLPPPPLPRFRIWLIRGVQGGGGAKPPWLGRLGKVLLVRIVKNVVVVYSSANFLTPSIGRF